jgi:hypothetical protein
LYWGIEERLRQKAEKERRERIAGQKRLAEARLALELTAPGPW